MKITSKIFQSNVQSDSVLEWGYDRGVVKNYSHSDPWYGWEFLTTPYYPLVGTPTLSVVAAISRFNRQLISWLLYLSIRPNLCGVRSDLIWAPSPWYEYHLTHFITQSLDHSSISGQISFQDLTFQALLHINIVVYNICLGCCFSCYWLLKI